MDIEPNHERCVGQELDEEDTATFTFNVIELHKDISEHQAVVKIMDPDETSLYQKTLTIGGPEEEYVASMQKRGQHYLCFELLQGESPVRAIFSIDYKNRDYDLPDPSKKVEKDNIPTLENQLKMAESSLHLISNEIDFARRQEVELRDSGEITNARIQWLSILSILVLLTVSLWQILYLRSFFASKKLL